MQKPTQEILNKMKNTLKRVAWSLGKKVLIIALPFIIIIILIVACYDTLMDAFSDKAESYTSNNPVQYDAEDGSIVVSDEIIDNLIKELEESGFKLEDLHLSKESISKFYAAEVVSQEINRGIAEEENKYYGKVYVKKSDSGDDTSENAKDMQYLDYTEFKEKYEENDESLKNCFSINDGKLVVVSSTTTTDANGTKTALFMKELEYKPAISKYIMPIEFLMELCTITQNPGFVEELADKVINETEIIIDVMDCETVIETKTTEKYKEAISKDTEGRVCKIVQKNGNEEYNDTGARNPARGNPTVTLPSASDSYKTGETVTTKTISHNPTIQITSVKTWIMNQTKVYSNKKEGPTNQGPYSVAIDDEEPKHTDETYIDSGRMNKYTDTNGQSMAIKYYDSEVKYKVNRINETTETITTNKYEADVGTEEYKIDEFIEMLEKEYNIPDRNILEAPIYNLNSGAEIFLNMLNKGSRTQHLEQIMRYVLNKYNNTTSYGNIDLKNIGSLMTIIDLEMVGFSYNVNTAISDQELVVKDKKVLEDAIQKLYSGNVKDNLISEIPNFLEMQNKYSTNAVFAIAVTLKESSAGTNWDLIDKSTHNWYSIKGSYNGNSYKDREGTNWCSYPSFKEATLDFGDWMANSQHYFKAGKYTVDQIAPTYCNELWGEGVTAFMNEIYKAAGIDVTPKGFVSGGIRTDEQAQQMQNYIENELINTKYHYHDSAYQNGPFAKWWGAMNPGERFQCTWWAWGRASMYLEQIKSKISVYPRLSNGGDFYDFNVSNGWFNYGKIPKPNSIISWKHGTYGHVAYVEGVSEDGKWIYISHAGSGNTWFGIDKIPSNGDLASGLGWSGYTCNGFIYLDEAR